jgi:hypothetical protein
MTNARVSKPIRAGGAPNGPEPNMRRGVAAKPNNQGAIRIYRPPAPTRRKPKRALATGELALFRARARATGLQLQFPAHNCMKQRKLTAPKTASKFY